jgi:hypothetical protein
LNAAAALVARCFAARTSTHIDHLTTRSYAQHMALGDFYDAVATSADEFVECYMAIHGKLDSKDFPSIRPTPGGSLNTLTDLRTWIVENREEVCEPEGDKDSENERDDVDCKELASLIDNILAVVDRAIYKLKFLS